jgi:hypothetical protein
MDDANSEPSEDHNAGDIRGNYWSAQMGWRYVTYREDNNPISLQIEPMVSGPDIAKKALRNRSRDQRVNRELAKSGWRVVRIWECHLETHPDKCIRRLRKHLPSSA